MLVVAVIMSDSPQGSTAGFQKRVVLFPEAVIILDFKGTITRIDKQTVAIFGWDNESEVVGKNFVDFSAE